MPVVVVVVVVVGATISSAAVSLAFDRLTLEQLKLHLVLAQDCH